MTETLLGDDDFDALDGLGGGEGGVDAEIGEAVVDCQDVAAIAGVHGPAAREGFPCGRATAVDKVETGIDKLFAIGEFPVGGIGKEVLHHGGDPLAGRRETATFLAALFHPEAAIVVVVGGDGGAFFKFEPPGFDDSLTQGDVATDVVEVSHLVERLGCLAWKVGVVGEDKLPHLLGANLALAYNRCRGTTDGCKH